MTALAALLRDDVVISMPPHDLWLQGPDNVIGWMVGPGHACEGSKLLPVQANGTAGFGSYKPAAPGRWEPWALQVIEVARRPAVRPPQLPLPRAVRRVRAPAVPRRLTLGDVAFRGHQPEGGPMEPSAVSYPLTFTLEPPPDTVARWRPFVRWLLVIPHLLVLYVLQIVASVCAFVAWFAILFTGKMPEGLAGLITMSIRYQMRALTYGTSSARSTRPSPSRRPPPTRVTTRGSTSTSSRSSSTATASPCFFRGLLVIPSAIVLGLIGIARQRRAPHRGVRRPLHRPLAGGAADASCSGTSGGRRGCPATRCSSPTSTRRSRWTDRHSSRSTRSPTSSTSSSRSGCTLAEPDRPTEPARRSAAPGAVPRRTRGRSGRVRTRAPAGPRRRPAGGPPPHGVVPGPRPSTP